MDKLRTIGWAIVRRWTGVSGALVNLFILLVLLNILDYQTTDILVRLTNYSVEANPALRYAMESYGSASVILWIKGAVLAVSAFIFYWALHRAEKIGRLIPVKRLTNIVLFGLCVFYSLVVMHNTYGIYRLLS